MGVLPETRGWGVGWESTGSRVVTEVLPERNRERGEQPLHSRTGRRSAAVRQR